MNREILFRGKRKSDGEWIFGNLLQTNNDGICIIQNHVPHHLLKNYEVDPETVCQYTGLTDKNGRKIFEGDILSGIRYHDWGQGGEYRPDKCIIKWDEERAAFDPVYWWERYNHDLKDYEVIGNIFDNPELL